MQLIRKWFSSQLLQLLRHQEYIPGRNSPGNVQLEAGKWGFWESLESVIVEPYLMHECVGGGNWNTPHAVAVTQPLCFVFTHEMDLSYVVSPAAVTVITASSGPGSPPDLFL